jgi:hypothetical protein
MQSVDSLQDLFDSILLDPNISNQISEMNLDESGYDLADALTEWGNNMPPPSFDSSQVAVLSSGEISHSVSPSVAQESGRSGSESATSGDDKETVCYGMVSSHRTYLPELSNLGSDSPVLAAQGRCQARRRDANHQGRPW